MPPPKSLHAEITRYSVSREKIVSHWTAPHLPSESTEMIDWSALFPKLLPYFFTSHLV